MAYCEHFLKYENCCIQGNAYHTYYLDLFSWQMTTGNINNSKT